MSESKSAFPMPPRVQRADGGERCVGVELELIELELDSLAQLVREHVGGTLEQPGRYEYQVAGDAAGTWGVELDSGFLKRLGRQVRDPDNPFTVLDEMTEDILLAGAELIVPLEVVTPPLPLSRLVELDALVARLREAGAKGTGDALVYAFGMHFNPELPDTDAPTLLAWMRAFLCLYPWLKNVSRVDLARRITTFIAPYPEEYVQLVLASDYRPDTVTLIDDYLEFNPTRNRALDMLPMFAWLDEPRVRAKAPNQKINKRPTLHYRLPNCEIGVPGWSICNAWEHWLVVERLAEDSVQLDALCGRYLGYLRQPLAWLDDDWGEEVSAWLHRDFGH